MYFDHHQLESYNQSLLRLFSHTNETDPDTWLRNAVEELRQLVPFDSAWWGQVRPASDEQMAKNCMHGSIGLRPDFSTDWNQLSEHDDFAQRSMQHLGKAIFSNNEKYSDDYPILDANPAVNAFCHKHGICHCLAITLNFPNSGLQFFISIYRRAGRKRFYAADGFLLEQFSPHLLNGWIQILQRMYASQPSTNWHEQALTNHAGKFVYIGSQLSQVLDARFQDWQGSSLPNQLLQTLPEPNSRSTLGTHSDMLAQPCGSLTRISLLHRNEDSLSPRELKAAWCYAEGQSYKEAARTLGVTPATVRTYLQAAYRHLKVKNKVELLSALEQL